MAALMVLSLSKPAPLHLERSGKHYGGSWVTGRAPRGYSSSVIIQTLLKGPDQFQISRNVKVTTKCTTGLLVDAGECIGIPPGMSESNIVFLIASLPDLEFKLPSYARWCSQSRRKSYSGSTMGQRGQLRVR